MYRNIIQNIYKMSNYRPPNTKSDTAIIIRVRNRSELYICIKYRNKMKREND